MPAAAAACATSRTATYRRRQPERTVLYRTVQTHLATWLELAQDESGTAAHLADHVIPRLPVRQWVLSVPKRLRYFLRRPRRPKPGSSYLSLGGGTGLAGRLPGGSRQHGPHRRRRLHPPL